MIVYTYEALYHSLTHFEKLDENLLQHLISAGYTVDEIQQQLSRPGSKFFASFACSPMEVMDKICPQTDTFVFPEPDEEGRIRLSFKYINPIGKSGIISMDDLNIEEKASIYVEERNGCQIKKVRTLKETQTDECQIVMEKIGKDYSLITMFPGIAAPPISKNQEADPFWDNHCFIDL